MDKKPFKPFVPADTDMKELSLKAILLGVIMALYWAQQTHILA